VSYKRWLERVRNATKGLPASAYSPGKHNRQKWFSEGAGYAALAVSECGHLLVSGSHRRVLLCRTPINEMGSAYTRTIKDKNGEQRTVYSVGWSLHLPLETPLKILLKRTAGVTCQTCRDLLESIDSRLA
jgi:hypothetical protein